MVTDYPLAFNELEYGKKYIMKDRPNSMCYVDCEGYLSDKSLSSNDKRLMVATHDRFRLLPPQEAEDLTLMQLITEAYEEIKSTRESGDNGVYDPTDTEKRLREYLQEKKK